MLKSNKVNSQKPIAQSFAFKGYSVIWAGFREWIFEILTVEIDARHLVSSWNDMNGGGQSQSKFQFCCLVRPVSLEFINALERLCDRFSHDRQTQVGSVYLPRANGCAAHRPIDEVSLNAVH